MGAYVYFYATDANTAITLWRTDGTVAGTKGIDAVGNDGYLNPIVVGNLLYFTAYDQNLVYNNLWRSDGTEAGTYGVYSTVTHYSNLAQLNGELYFITNVGSTLSLNKTKGTSWDQVAALPAGPFEDNIIEAAGKIYFVVGSQLWQSDGTAAGTRAVAQFRGPGSGPTFNGAVLSDTLLFDGWSEATGTELFKVWSPTARVGSGYAASAGNSIQLDASASSDPAGDALQFTWDLDGDGIFGETGSAAKCGDEVGPTPIFKAYNLLPGGWTVWVDVANSTGVHSLASTQIAISLPDFIVFAAGSIWEWYGPDFARNLRLTSGMLTLTGNLAAAYPNVYLQVVYGSKLQVSDDQDLSVLWLSETASASLSPGVNVHVVQLNILGTQAHLDIGSGSIEITASQAQPWLGTTIGMINDGRIKSSALAGDPRLAIATVFQSASQRVVVEAARLGDLNVDGTVSISDFIDLASNFGKTNATWVDGDTNNDGTVSIADFINLASNFGQNYSPGVPQAPAAVEVVSVEQKDARHTPKRKLLHHRAEVRVRRRWSARARQWVV